MARIERNTITGTGNGTVAFDGWQFANVYSIGPIEIEYIKDGVTSNVPLEDERLIIQPGVLTVNVKTQPDNAWEFRLQNSIPEENQSELKIWKSGSGSTNISADDNIVFRGQDVDPATVDIFDLRVNLETLSQLFTKALSTHTVEDAARYVKMKQLYLDTFAE